VVCEVGVKFGLVLPGRAWAVEYFCVFSPFGENECVLNAS
jgi:hypothetical protein